MIWQYIGYGIHDRDWIYNFGKYVTCNKHQTLQTSKIGQLNVKTCILKTCIFVCDFLSINSTFYTLNILFSYIRYICLQAIFKRASLNANFDRPNLNLSFVLSKKCEVKFLLIAKGYNPITKEGGYLNISFV